MASAIRQVLPAEDMIYFGDTFHLPYGDKSQESVQYYSTSITDFLLEKQCKVIVIACNTASANAYQQVLKRAGSKAWVLNVVDPVVHYVVNQPGISKVGVIGTKGTINSNAYQHKLVQLDADIHVRSMATPLFVPMIEEGFVFDDISNAIIRDYLSRPEIQDIESLILGCTHYPIIKNQISKYYDFAVQVVDSARIVAMNLRDYLAGEKLLNLQGGQNEFFVSDYTDYFKVISKMFFEHEVHLEKIDFWH